MVLIIQSGAIKPLQNKKLQQDDIVDWALVKLLK